MHNFSQILFFLCLFVCTFAYAKTIEITVKLPIGIEKPRESHFRDALARELVNIDGNAKTEIKIKGGRVDIVTPIRVIEVDKAVKWHEAIGQACHYAAYLRLRPTIALYGLERLSQDTLSALNKTANKRRIDIIKIKLAEE